jgi:hypothetical protein
MIVDRGRRRTLRSPSPAPIPRRANLLDIKQVEQIHAFDWDRHAIPIKHDLL